MREDAVREMLTSRLLTLFCFESLRRRIGIRKGIIANPYIAVTNKQLGFRYSKIGCVV